MRSARLRLFFLSGILVLVTGNAKAQSCIPTGIQGSVFNFLCNQVCSTLVFQIPHIKSSDNYTLSSIPYNPYPYTTPTGIEDPSLYADDQYSFLINLPFNFCFYGAVYPNAVVGSNGIMTFDPANASCANAWPITQPIPFAGGVICSAGSTYYPRASIMGAYSDLDPRTIASPLNRKIQWDVFGTAPCRKFVVSYYRIGVFGNNPCGQATPNTFQMVIHESTGIVEIFTEQKACASSTNGGNGIQGMQNWNRDAAVWVPGRNPSFWTENNTGYRFTPSAGTSRFIISEMLDMSGNVIATADTLTTTPGLLDIRFPNFCVPAGTNQYVVRIQFSACENPATILTSLDTITISRTSSLGATATATMASCGPPDGTITVTVPPGIGTSPYTYVLDGGPPVVATSPYTFTNVAAGPHVITVTDASGGCTSTINITVNISGTISATTSSTATSCFGINNGTITITSAGGVGPYTFSLDGSPPVPGAIPFTFTNVTAGAHTVLVNDLGTGCNSGILSVTVAVGAGVSGIGNTTPTACPGVNTGTITVTATSGTAPFTWSLDGGPFLPGTNPYTFTNVSGGSHIVTIRDVNTCSILIPVTVAFGPGVSGNGITTATSCIGVNDGTITVTATSGTAPFTWSLDGGPFLPGPNPYTFTGVAAGPHTVTIMDAAGCNILIPVTVAAGPAPTATVNTTATACAGVNNGTIIVTSASMPGPYTFSLDGGPPVAGTLPFTFTNVSAGAHTVIVAGAAGCTTSPIPVTVTAGPGVSGVATSTATSCDAAGDGTITVEATAGTAPFTYQLDAGSPQSGTNPFTFTNVAAGTHTVIIRDNFTCSFTINNIVVAAGPPLTTTVTVTDVLCNGGNTGLITVTPPIIGTPPYQYSLDGTNWQSSNIFSGLTAGLYTVYYRESNGCQGQQNVTINEPAAMTSSAVTTAVTCNGLGDGTITITAGGGVTPYQYSIDGGANWQTVNTFTVAAGNYSIIIRDANNCTILQTAVVTEPALLTAASVNANASCNGGNDGTITVTASGGNSGGYQYSLDGVNFQASNIFNVAPGNYTITVRDNLGCTTSFPAVVGLTSNLTFTPQADVTICEGSSANLNLVSNATVYSWSPSAGLSNPNVANPTANPTTTTAYIVTATLSRCSINDTVIVNVNPAPVPDAGRPGFICYGQNYQLQASGGVQYFWSPSTYLDNPLLPNPTSSTRRTITYTLSIIADVNGCPSLVTDDVTVDVTPPIKIYTFPADTIAYPGDRIQLSAVSAVPSANNFIWTPSINLSNPYVSNPVVTAGSIGDSLVYKVTASSAAGCIGEAYVRLRVYKGPDLYVPTAFTPNGDGRNETFYPFPVGIKAINYFKVFNRWGQMVFSSTILYKGWDGRLQGVEQPTGTYVWMAQGIDNSNKTITRQGTVTLIR
jgi:gliding motility-associated-like protein